jgi:hypothetical protein
MQRKNIIIILLLVFALGLSLILFDSVSAQWRTQNIPSSAKDTDLSLSPSKGSDDAPVEIAVFSCFE